MAANAKNVRSVLLNVFEAALQRPEVQARVVNTALRCLGATADVADAFSVCVSAGAEILKARAAIAPKLDALQMRSEVARATLSAESAERDLGEFRKTPSRRRGGKAKKVNKVNGTVLDLGPAPAKKGWEDEFLREEQ